MAWFTAAGNNQSDFSQQAQLTIHQPNNHYTAPPLGIFYQSQSLWTSPPKPPQRKKDDGTKDEGQNHHGQQRAWRGRLECSARRQDRPTQAERTTRSPLDSPFIDSAVAVSGSNESDDSGEGESIAVSRRKRKTPSLRAPSPISDVQSDGSEDESDALGDITHEPHTKSHAAALADAHPARRGTTVVSSVPPALSFTISNLVVNVPHGHTGPILLQLDIPALNRPDHTKPSTSSSQQVPVAQGSSPRPRRRPGTHRRNIMMSSPHTTPKKQRTGSGPPS